MKKGATMKKRVLKILQEQTKPMSAKELCDIASSRWRWAPTVMQIAMVCSTTKFIKKIETVDETRNSKRWRAVLWKYEELPDSGNQKN